MTSLTFPMILTFVMFFIFLFLGMPIGFVLGISSTLYFLFSGQSSYLISIPQRLFNGINVYVLLAVPFFILSGEIMNYTKMSDRLIDLCNDIAGKIRGGLAHVNVLASIIFAGMTGLAFGDIGAIGTVIIPAMKKQGYDAEFSAAVTAASSIIGPIIPPSVVTVIYGAIMGVSIGGLFAGAIIPGLLIGAGDFLIVALYSKKRHYPKRTNKIHLKQRIKTFKKALPALFMPIIILGGILSGVVTPTEAAATAAGYGLLIGFFVIKKIKLKNIYPLLFRSLTLSCLLLFIVGTARILSFVLSLEQIPQLFSAFILSVTSDVHLVLLLIILFLLFIGTWMDLSASILLLGPIFAPLTASLGVNPIHFGIIMLVTLNIGLVTPPLGVCLYAVAPIAKVSVNAVLRDIWPFLLINIIGVLLITFIPELVLFLPRILGFI